MAFNARDRADLLAECFPRMRRLAELIETAEETGQNLRPQITPLTEQLTQLWEAYRTNVPVLELSRCPFTKEVWAHSLDNIGIDGLWWSLDKPQRPLDEPMGGKYLSFTGAVRHADPIPAFPFLAEPGPEKPFVIPRLFEVDSVKAVVSHVMIGELDAYPIVYFSDQSLPDECRTNDWGIDKFSYTDAAGVYRSGEWFDAEDEYDYVLEPWIDAGRLLWIAPGDTSLTLRTGTAQCPYLKLPGKRAVWRAKEGRVWWGDEVPTGP
ncbi:hypothetical protein Pan216_13270 [Planctomycetes bacterium Pan216]|uniref:Uncharacterized protein n=1 Tax=Kolteria novifilia TaxID=2527975 RepID=A0A518B0I8_9BACT|nr:hypothetical protein Pan216_13270 [Planctomycetes bacterium Pan216]